MKTGAAILPSLLNEAGITINGSNPWDVQVRNEKLFSRIWREHSLGLGEAYIDGWWDCERTDQFINRLLHGKIQARIRGNLALMLQALPSLLLNLQSKARARIVADRHYNLGNDLFSAFLDPYMQYSCAFFDGTDSLEEAQLKKLEMICTKLDLAPGDHLLDIGCGWGGLARYAAEQCGCKVTGVNISKEQLAFGRESCKGLPVQFVDSDYRDITGQFDKIVSVGMFEHVGERNYATYLDVVHRCLKPDGIFLLHTIGSNSTTKGASEAWLSKYIFPNSKLPSAAQIASTAEDRFIIEDWHNFGPHYDKTLMAWHERFQNAWPQLKGSKYDERFKRMWDYYLLCCAATFRSRQTQLWQVVMTAADSGRAQPPYCRTTPGQRQASDIAIPIQGDTAA